MSRAGRETWCQACDPGELDNGSAAILRLARVDCPLHWLASHAQRLAVKHRTRWLPQTIESLNTEETDWLEDERAQGQQGKGNCEKSTYPRSLT